MNNTTKLNDEIKEKLSKFAANGGCLPIENKTYVATVESYIESLQLNKSDRTEAARFYWRECNLGDLESTVDAAVLVIMSEFSLDADTAYRIVEES